MNARFALRTLGLLAITIASTASIALAQDATDLPAIGPKELEAAKLWSQCRDHSTLGLLAGNLDESGEPLSSALPDECKPDTLYAWGNSYMLSLFQQAAPTDGPWQDSFAKPMFFHVNPIGSFAYGYRAVRAKLKAGVTFKLIGVGDITSMDQLCPALGDAAASTVIVAEWSHDYPYTFGGTDYIICSPKVFESWSTGTPQHFQEVLKAKAWVDSQPRSTWITYLNEGKDRPDLVASDSNNTLNVDGKDWSSTALDSNIAFFRQMVSAQASMTSLNPDVPGATDSQFRTSHPSYWQPEN